MQMFAKKRIEIFVEAPALHRLTDALEKAGVKGYTILPALPVAAQAALGAVRDKWATPDALCRSSASPIQAGSRLSGRRLQDAFAADRHPFGRRCAGDPRADVLRPPYSAGFSALIQ